VNAGIKTWPKSLAHRPPSELRPPRGWSLLQGGCPRAAKLDSWHEAEAPVIPDGHAPHPDSGKSIAFFGELHRLSARSSADLCRAHRMAMCALLPRVGHP